MASDRQARYRELLAITVEDIVVTHDEVTRTGRTWDVGVRDPGSLDFLVERIRDMAREGHEPAKIAAWAMGFIVRSHPFGDGNHRTAFDVGQVILDTLGLEIVAERDEVERFVRGIDARGLTDAALSRWIRKRAKKLR